MNTPQTTVKVWDIPTRLFHWSLASAFTIAFVTSESERLQNIHTTAGYTVLGLIAFRLLWGVVGNPYARFSNFVRGPAAIMSYLRSLLGSHPEHHIGHNPAGAVAIVLLLVLGVATGLSGWANYSEIGGHAMEEVHEFCANAMMAVVVMHLAGVAVSSLLHKENLVRAMISGRKNVSEKS